MRWASDWPDEPAPADRRDTTLANWRVLLPLPPEGSFTHLFLSGGSEELESIIRDLGLAEQVSRSLPQPGSADAAVLLDGSHPPLPQVAQCLKGEGLLYWEFRRPGLVHFRPSTTRILAQLPAPGPSPIRLYCVRPESGLAPALL